MSVHWSPVQLLRKGAPRFCRTYRVPLDFLIWTFEAKLPPVSKWAHRLYQKSGKMVSSSAWATVTNWRRPGDLNNKHLFLRVWRADVPRSRCSRFRAPWEPPSWFRRASLLCPHLVERAVISLMSLLLRVLIPSMRTRPSWPSHSPKGPTSTFHLIGNEGFNIGIQRGRQKHSIH